MGIESPWGRSPSLKEGIMVNMSYCRFENTFHDLDDCYDNMEGEDLSESELKYREKLISLCSDIASDYGED